ncbi:MAG: ABC transporter ATP-binding protein [Proteobacteria bacterium]|nr:ABC transporter ATP-binding protein [Pseudomonadota bacterium]
MTAPGTASDAAPPVALRSVVREYPGRRPSIFAPRTKLRAVDGVSLDVPRGRTLGIVGESGCGKSTLARMMVGLLPPTEGDILIGGRPVGAYQRRELSRLIQMVFQDPTGSLNPRRTVRRTLEAPLAALRGMNQAARGRRVEELMGLVGLRADFADRYPHEFSGGQSQRIGIARALAAEADILVLDEPVSALDVSVQAQVLALLQDLQRRLGLSYVFISHDLAVVDAVADEVAVMQRGRIVEFGVPDTIFTKPSHAYTRELLASHPGQHKV